MVQPELKLCQNWLVRAVLSVNLRVMEIVPRMWFVLKAFKVDTSDARLLTAFQTIDGEFISRWVIQPFDYGGDEYRDFADWIVSPTSRLRLPPIDIFQGVEWNQATKRRYLLVPETKDSIPQHNNWVIQSSGFGGNQYSSSPNHSWRMVDMEDWLLLLSSLRSFHLFKLILRYYFKTGAYNYVANEHSKHN